jgi:hypothetical protein
MLSNADFRRYDRALPNFFSYGEMIEVHNLNLDDRLIGIEPQSGRIPSIT